MNGKERVFATLSGAPCDRRPFTATLCLYGARLTGRPLLEHYRCAAAYAEGQAAVRDAFHPDILFSPFAFALIGEAFGVGVKFFPNQAPNTTRPAVASVDDLPGLSFPDIDSHPNLLYVREALRAMVASTRGEAAIAAPTPGPAELAIMVLGMDATMNMLLFDHVGFERVMDMFYPFYERWCNALLADGADCVVVPATFLSPALLPRDVIETVALPVYNRAFQLVKGPVVAHHAGAPLGKLVDIASSFPGNVIALVPDGKDDYAACRQLIPSRMALIYGLNGISLPAMSADEVEAVYRQIAIRAGEDARLILATAGPDVPFETPRETISAIGAAVIR